jgi:hypothetical protein
VESQTVELTSQTIIKIFSFVTFLFSSLKRGLALTLLGAQQLIAVDAAFDHVCGQSLLDNPFDP